MKDWVTIASLATLRSGDHCGDVVLCEVVLRAGAEPMTPVGPSTNAEPFYLSNYHTRSNLRIRSPASVSSSTLNDSVLHGILCEEGKYRFPKRRVGNQVN